jgi:hypothetical protein
MKKGGFFLPFFVPIANLPSPADLFLLYFGKL